MAAFAVVDPGTHGLSSVSREQKYSVNVPQVLSSALYFFRARDSAAPGYPTSTPAYVTWTGPTTTTAYGGALPFGGPLVDTVFKQVK